MACALWLLHNIYYVTYNVVLLHPQLQTSIFVHALVSENIFDLKLKNAISDNLVYSLFTTFLGWRGYLARLWKLNHMHTIIIYVLSISSSQHIMTASLLIVL